MDIRQEKHDNEKYSKNFTRIPNILFASYKKLTKEEKFLYCTLREVYWDMKPRFVSTRDLSELTGYSRGALANMLPRLNDCGLIHAEIRRERDRDGNEKGNAKYHITIPDIWELNKQFFASSPEEQEEIDPSLKLVHLVDKNKTRPPNGQTRPPNEPSLSMKSAKPGSFHGQDQARVERAKDSNKDILKERKKERTLSVPVETAPTESDSSSHSSTHSSSSTQDETQYPIVTVATRNAPSSGLSPEEERIQGYWCELGMTERPSAQTHWATLSKHIASFENFESLFTHTQDAIKTKPDKEVHPGNLVKCLDGWKQEQKRLMDSQTKEKVREIATIGSLTRRSLSSLPRL